MKTYHLKIATSEDAAHLASLWSRTFIQAYRTVHTRKNIDVYCRHNFTHEQAQAALSDPSIHCVISTQDGQPCGFYTLKDTPCPHSLDGTSAELKQIYILSSEYGAGLGRLLFEDAMKALTARSIEWMWLSVSDKNTRAQAFYDKLNFKTIGTGPRFEVGTDRLTSTVLAKSISRLAVDSI